MENKKITSALISVFDKSNLEPLIKELAHKDVTLYSTGGTKDFIQDLGYEVLAVEDLTGYPSILGGRVKTLHPKIFGGILKRSNNENDSIEMEKFQIPSFDLVVVDLYPFEKTVAENASEVDIIEKIDIGGIALIRAAAKTLITFSVSRIKTIMQILFRFIKSLMVLLQLKRGKNIPLKLSTYHQITILLFLIISTKIKID